MQEQDINPAKARGRPRRPHAGGLRALAAPAGEAERKRLDRLARGGEAEKLDRGLYLVDAGAISEGHEFAACALRLPEVVIGLESALAFHRLVTELPRAVAIGLRPGRHPPRWSWPAIAPWYLPARDTAGGIEVHELEGVQIRVTSVARTVAECFRHTERLGTPLCLEGLRTALVERRCSGDDLWHQIEAFGVSATVRPYIAAIQV